MSEKEKKEDNDNRLSEEDPTNYSNILGKDLFQEEKDFTKTENLINETILDKKINNEIKKDVNSSRISEFVQSEEITNIEKSLHISIIEPKKENEFLTVRKIESYDISEYDTIKQKYSQKLKIIEDNFLNKVINYNEINKENKIGPLLPLITLIESTYLFKPEYKNIMISKYERLKEKIYNYRTVCGDDNCYYKAVMLRYIELPYSR